MPRKSKVGEVVKKSGDKTIKVMVETLKKHPLYKKYIRRKNFNIGEQMIISKIILIPIEDLNFDKI